MSRSASATGSWVKEPSAPAGGVRNSPIICILHGQWGPYSRVHRRSSVRAGFKLHRIQEVAERRMQPLLCYQQLERFRVNDRLSPIGVDDVEGGVVPGIEGATCTRNSGERSERGECLHGASADL